MHVLSSGLTIVHRHDHSHCEHVPKACACITLTKLKRMHGACSLAIMTDAAHLLSDVSGFAVAIFAAYYASKKSASTHTFG